MRTTRKSEKPAVEFGEMAAVAAEPDVAPVPERAAGTAWGPEKKAEVLEYLAGGFSLNRTSAMSGVPRGTIAMWQNDPNFGTLLQEARSRFVEGAKSGVSYMVYKAQSIVNEALNGQREPQEPVVLLAERLLARTSHRAIVLGAGIPLAGGVGGTD